MVDTLINTLFPPIGMIKGSHEGSQSTAPDSSTTPKYNESEEAENARWAAASRMNRTVSKMGHTVGSDINRNTPGSNDNR